MIEGDRSVCGLVLVNSELVVVYVLELLVMGWIVVGVLIEVISYVLY